MDKSAHMAEIARRWETMHAELKEKGKRIENVRDSDQVDRLLSQAVKSSSRSKALMWLQKAADTAAAPLQPHSGCVTGCSHCCRGAVSVSDTEARQIAKDTGIPLATVNGWNATQSDDRRAEGQKWGGVPCTFLKEGRCSIYASRPLACRLHLNMDVDGFLCIQIPGEAISVPYADMTQHHFAAAIALGVHSVIADIREWFPSGVATDAS